MLLYDDVIIPCHLVSVAQGYSSTLRMMLNYTCIIISLLWTPMHSLAPVRTVVVKLGIVKELNFILVSAYIFGLLC